MPARERERHVPEDFYSYKNANIQTVGSGQLAVGKKYKQQIFNYYIRNSFNS